MLSGNGHASGWKRPWKESADLILRGGCPMKEKLNKSRHQPVKDSVAKVPMIMQMEALECGAACLCMILAYYQKWVPLEQVRLDCGVSRDGSNMKNVYLAGQNYGLEVHGYKMELDGIKTQATYPCIIHWNFNHFVVLDGFKKGKAVINDPARGIVQVSMEEFDESFTGLVGAGRRVCHSDVCDHLPVWCHQPRHVPNLF